MDELAQLLATGSGGRPTGDVRPDTSSPTGFRNSSGQFVKPGAPDKPAEGQPMDGMNDRLAQALAGSGSPEEMEQQRRYQQMLKMYPKFAPSQPRITGQDLGAAITAGPETPDGQPMPPGQPSPQDMQNMDPALLRLLGVMR